MATDDYWIDTGNPELYLQANLDLLDGTRRHHQLRRRASRRRGRSDRDRGGQHRRRRRDRRGTARSSPIRCCCRAPSSGARAVVTNSVVMGRIGAGASVTDSVLGLHGRVDAGRGRVGRVPPSRRPDVNILVVGGAGFLGSHLVDRLIAEDHAVDVVDDLSTGSLANLADARAAGGALKIHTLDVLADEFAALVGDAPARRRLPPGVAAAGPWRRRARPGAPCRACWRCSRRREPQGAKVVAALPAAALYGDVPLRDLPIKEGHAWNPVGLARDHRQGRRRPAQPVPGRSHRRVHRAGAEHRLRAAPARRRRRGRRVRPRAAQRRRAR